MSVIYKETTRERDWDLQSHASRKAPSSVIRRYRVADDNPYGDDHYEETRIVTREREADPPVVRQRYVVDRDSDRASGRDVHEYRYVERDVDRPASPRRDVHEYRIKRDVIEHSPSPPRVRQYTIEREIDEEPNEPYALEKYSKSTEFFSRPDPPPQPIVIRQSNPQPIIVQEAPVRQQIILRREEPQYEFIERSEVEDRQVAKRPDPREDDYYYERRIREVDHGRGWEEDDYYERERGRARHGEHDWHSDDEYEYIRRTRDEEFRDRSPHHRRHLAEGIVAGVGAAQLIRHQRRQKGEDPGHGVRQSLGYEGKSQYQCDRAEKSLQKAPSLS
ncbi:hypothetical protein SLS55_009446 [Diplodia seriata]|uniref:Uncharacterized protein n=1 Tax=Diplodia seriata TaxID=420778 RepID=A0ABR3C2R3_9PEZI